MKTDAGITSGEAIEDQEQCQEEITTLLGFHSQNRKRRASIEPEERFEQEYDLIECIHSSRR